MQPIVPDWPVPRGVKALMTTRAGGRSRGPYASLNVGAHCGDDPADVAANRELVTRSTGGHPPRWLAQVHGTRVVDADAVDGVVAPPEADAAVARRAGVVCAIQVADCMPVLFADREGTAVAAAHAGWRGLAGGVLEATIAALGLPPSRLTVWMGPAIGPAAYEVGSEVREAFVAQDAGCASAFRPNRPGHWLMDLYAIASRRLTAAGVSFVHGGGWCTHTDAERFFSFRRDGATGRMAALIWRE